MDVSEGLREILAYVCEKYGCQDEQISAVRHDSRLLPLVQERLRERLRAKGIRMPTMGDVGSELQSVVQECMEELYGGEVRARDDSEAHVVEALQVSAGDYLYLSKDGVLSTSPIRGSRYVGRVGIKAGCLVLIGASDELEAAFGHVVARDDYRFEGLSSKTEGRE